LTLPQLTAKIDVPESFRLISLVLIDSFQNAHRPDLRMPKSLPPLVATIPLPLRRATAIRLCFYPKSSSWWIPMVLFSDGYVPRGLDDRKARSLLGKTQVLYLCALIGRIRNPTSLRLCFLKCPRLRICSFFHRRTITLSSRVRPGP
jgi:hypothetical protein